jgi:uncharacterized protein (TIGR02444 family)
MRSLAAKKRGRNQALWGFATGLYARPGVAPACLALQDGHGVDIPLLLAAIWHGETGRGRLDRGQAGDWRACARLWRAAAIVPLRTARTAIRAAAKADPAIDRLRKTILAAELAAERLLLRDLEALSRPGTATDPRTRRADARINAAIFVRDPRARTKLTKIISALGPST